MVSAVQSKDIMRLHPWQQRLSLQGRQVHLSLLVVLLSHLLLMVTPLHEAVVLGHGASHQAMVTHSAHAAHGDCLKLTANLAHPEYDCAIRGNTPTRSGLGLLFGPTSVGRAAPTPLLGLLPSLLERSTWPPPFLDLQILFQVFRI